MRFIGNKENIVEKIYNILLENNVKGNSFFDFFSGTSNVGKFFKRMNYQIFSSDIMYFSFVLQRAYLVNNEIPLFEKIISKYNLENSHLFNTKLELVVAYLNTIPENKGFIYKNYTPEGTSNFEQPRMYFTGENGQKIDAIRNIIEEWFCEKLINENEYYILLACLIESVPFYANIAGVYAAFHKKWDPRALKPLILRPIEIISNTAQNKSYNSESSELLDRITADIFYLDPPYNQRQYAPNYHLLETIAKNDNPQIKGVTGLRNYDTQKSKFCNPKTAIEQLNLIASEGKFKFLVMSYSSEGIMKKEDIICTLEKYGKVRFIDFEYLRYRSNSKGESKTKKFVHEHLYILEK